MPNKPLVTLLILDLDNTLWDWFDIWYSSFQPFYEAIKADTGLPDEALKRQIKSVFEIHGTTEYSFLLEELPVYREKFGQFAATERLPHLIELYQKGRKSATKLYPDVMSTLLQVKASGCRIVAYTESLAYYTSQRIRTMQLDGLIECVYSPQDHEVPKHLTPEQTKRFSPDAYALKSTQARHTEAGVLKPDTRVLEQIIQEFGVTKSQAAYVGDNLAKDVLMARRVGVYAVHANYGESHNDPRYELLKDVTHWTPKAVEEQKAATAKAIQPDFILDKGFADILKHFDFARSSSSTPSDDAMMLEAWKQTVNTQQHFNDLQLRLRSFMVTLLVAVLGAAGFAIKEHSYFHLWHWSLSSAILACMAGVVGILACAYFDFGYHQLLVGAVVHGLEIEKRAGNRVPSLQLAHRIKESSPVIPLFFQFFPNRLHGWLESKKFWWLSPLVSRLSSTSRLKRFYLLIVLLLVAIAVFAQFASSSASGQTPSSAGDVHTPGSFTIGLPTATCGDAALRKYFASGAFERNCRDVIANARPLIETEIARAGRIPLAAVFDIDDTALSTWTILDAGGFCWDKPRYDAYVALGTMPANLAVLSLFKELRSRGVQCFFVSSREENQRAATESNLRLAGFSGFERVLLRADGDISATAELKAGLRAQIEGGGVKVVVNVGDQLADLEGGHSAVDVLIPNPFYTSK